MSKEEAIKILSEMQSEYNLFGDEEEATRYHVLSWAIKEMNAEPVKQERCEFCKDGKTFWGAELILDNEGNWHNIEYCPICGAKMGEIEEEKTPRLIDANEILKSEHQHYAPMADEYYVPVRDIENAPTVDAVEVVRCKDCKWGTPHPEGDEYTKCFKLCTTFFSGHYCAWGERKEDVETD